MIGCSIHTHFFDDNCIECKREYRAMKGIGQTTLSNEDNQCAKNDGKEVYEVLTSLGYEISDKNKLVGEAKGEKVKDAIYDFFDDVRNNPDDILLFYYSGHGVLDVDGRCWNMLLIQAPHQRHENQIHHKHH